ncbi:Uncharacterised protein [Mycobacterium tuberculosis]|nr:Uncharacterised protein [Mycobacterium tuberculosis]
MPGAATAGPTPATANIGGAAMTPVRAADSNCGYWPSQVAIWAMCVGKSTTTT